MDTIDKAKLVAAIRAAVTRNRNVPDDYAEYLQRGIMDALGDVRNGALPATAVHARTGLSWRVLCDTLPAIAALIEEAHAEARISAEQTVRGERPLDWLRTADPDTWTPKEKREHSGDLKIYVEFGDDPAAGAAFGAGDGEPDSEAV